MKKSGVRKALYLLYSHYEGDPRPRRQAEALRDAGWEVTVLSLTNPDEARRFAVDGVDVVGMRFSRYRGTSAFSYIFAYCRFVLWSLLQVCRHWRRYDFVHVHTPPDFLAFASLPARWGGAGVLLDIHDPTPELFKERFGNRRAWVVGWARLLERWSTAIVHHVITVNEPVRRLITGRSVSEDKISVIMNLPDEGIFWRDEISPPPETPILAYHGTLVPHFGAGVLLEAAALLVPSYPDLGVRILGDGDMRSELVARSNQPDLSGRVYISPARVPVHRIPEELGRVTVGVVANRSGGFPGLALPTKLLEYLALGIPVVVTRTETIDHYFRPGELITVDGPDPAAFAKALRPLLEDPEAGIRQAAKGREFLTRHSWARERGAYVTLAERLAAKTRSRSAKEATPISGG